MLFTPILQPARLAVWNLINQTRNVRPNIKICREKFQLSVDVKQFKKDEIRVKAAPEYLIIEGKQEKRTDRGLILRQFYKKFKLPEGCSTETVESKLSDDGILTVIAPRRACGRGMPCERLVAIQFGGPSKNREDESQIKILKNEDKGVPSCNENQKK